MPRPILTPGFFRAQRDDEAVQLAAAMTSDSVDWSSARDKDQALSSSPELPTSPVRVVFQMLERVR